MVPLAKGAGHAYIRNSTHVRERETGDDGSEAREQKESETNLEGPRDARREKS